MEPLTITAAVTGLLGATVSVYNKLDFLRVGVRDVPQEIHILLTETHEMQSAVVSLQGMVRTATELPKHRTSLISLDYLVATITETIMTISQLDSFLEPLKNVHTPAYALVKDNILPLRDRIKVMVENAKTANLVRRMQRNKASLSPMFNIIRW